MNDRVMAHDYDTAKYTDSELVSELGEVPGRPYRSPTYFDALRQEVKRRDLKVPSAESPSTVEQGPLPDIPPAAGAAPATYRLWVNMKGTILVRMWDGGAVEVARRDATWETWRPPETLFEETT